MLVGPSLIVLVISNVFELGRAPSSLEQGRAIAVSPLVAGLLTSQNLLLELHLRVFPNSCSKHLKRLLLRFNMLLLIALRPHPMKTLTTSFSASLSSAMITSPSNKSNHKGSLKCSAQNVRASTPLTNARSSMECLTVSYTHLTLPTKA